MDSLDVFAGTYSDHIVDTAQRKRIPLSGTFELLPNCNMRCKMCYIQHTPSVSELLPVEFWVKAFEQAIREGMLFALLTGGEPLLYPHFFELYEKAAKMPAYLCINTNATLLNREKVKELAKNPPRRINISLYGASNETYGRLCGNPKGFEQVVNAFDLLKEFGIQFRVHSSIVPDNVNDYSGIIDVCNHYQVPLQMTNYMFPSCRKETGCITADGRFTPKEMALQQFRYLKDQFGGETEGYRQYIEQRCMGIEHPELYSLYGKNSLACRGGVCSFWVDWRGNISGCGVHNQGALDLHKVSLKDAWTQITEETDKIRISDKCKYCKYRCICFVCPAACYCETGCMQGTPEYLCSFCEEYSKLFFAERGRLREKE